MKGIRFPSLLLVLMLLATLLYGCNTLHGFGKDLEEGGEAVQEAVD